MASPAGDGSAGNGGPAGADEAGFIRGRTALARPPLIPELELYLSQADPTELWGQTERDRAAPDLAPPFWAYPWAGGIALARYVLDHPGLVAGRTVLDLASGSGLVAIAAARAGAARVLASDIDPLAVAAIRLNAAANNVAIEATPDDLLTPPPGDWLTGAEPTVAGDTAVARAGAAAWRAFAARQPGTSVILTGDVCYERRMAGRVLAFLSQARAAGATVLIGDPGRAYLPGTGLREVASYAVPCWPGLEDTEVRRGVVWEQG